MKVLVLTPYLPHRRVGHGGGTAVRDLVTSLASKHTVCVVSLVRPGEEDLLAEVAALGVEVRGLPFLDGGASGSDRARLAVRRLKAWLRSLGSGYPFYAEKYWNDRLSAEILQAAAAFRPEAVQVEYLQMAHYCRELRFWRGATRNPLPRLVLNSHELGSVPRERRAARAGNPLVRLMARAEAAAWRRFQVAASGWADTTLCVTPGDRELYAAMGGHHLETVPLGMDLAAVAPAWQPGAGDGRETYLFVGSFGHRPNVLAAAFLLERVWPRVAAARPQAVLLLAGRGSLEFLAGRRKAGTAVPPRVEALGFVDDLGPTFGNCRLFLAPLAEGGGIKIKILEAMARGVPVVTTPIGAEGIAGPQDGVLTITACDDSFADAVLTDAEDLAGCRTRASAARRHMERHFGWDAITDRLTEIYSRRDNS